MQCNIRVLGGLVSAHLLASDSANKLFQGAYKNQLLVLAEDLGNRFLPAFDSPTGLPYAWINLKVLHKKWLYLAFSKYVIRCERYHTYLFKHWEYSSRLYLPDVFNFITKRKASAEKF